MKLDLRSFGLAICIIIAFIAFSQLFITTLYPSISDNQCNTPAITPDKNTSQADINAMNQKQQQCFDQYNAQMNDVRQKRFITGLIIALLTVILAVFVEVSVPTKYGLFASGALTVLISSFQAPEGTYIGVAISFLILVAIIYFIEKEEDE
ncbi:Uncharacterised protein [uncultured archaeon]|nr:Uncharacterised protein [uncultured archaeon]